MALEYGYDLNGNRTSAYDLRQGNEWPMNHRYSYDGLNRLTMAERNARSEFVFSAPTEAPEKGSQAWLLDPLGNWLELETWSSSSTSATETRTHNKVNELLDRDIPGTSADHTLAYDNAGNLYTDAVSGGSTTTYTHDLWNRLVKVTVGSTVKLEQQFNGLTWRMLKREDTGGSAGLDEERTFTYNANWQLIEERVDANYISSPSLDKRVQYFWGLRYIDDCIMHRADFNNDGDYVDTRENSWYHLTDGMFSSVALLNRTGGIAERVTYDSYGKARHHRPYDVDGDGSSGTTDYNIVNAIISGGAVSIGNASYRAECDLNRDGTINTTDRSLAGTTASAIAAGLISHPDSGGPDNSIGWDGYVFNPATGDYLSRMRIYRPSLGRWLSRDPIRYGDGANLYLANHGAPTRMLDPTGLKPCCGPSVTYWFAKEVRIHTSFWNQWSGGPLVRPLYFARYAATIPYKWMDFGSDCEKEQGKGCAGTVMLCGVCIHKSELGNLMFGAMGKLWLRGERLVLGGGRKGGRPEGIDSPEDLGGVLGGIFLTVEADELTQLSPESLCKILRQDHSENFGKLRPLFNEKYRELFDKVNPADLLGTMGSQYSHCKDCGAGIWMGGHSDFSTVTTSEDLAKGWNERRVYKRLPINWPGDKRADPCECYDEAHPGE